MTRVDHELGDLIEQLVLGLTLLLEGTPINRDAVRQGVAVAPVPLGEGRALVEAEEHLVWVQAHVGQHSLVRSLLHEDLDVLHALAKAPRNRAHRLAHQRFELRACHFARRR